MASAKTRLMVILFICLFCGCFTRPSLMTNENYEEIQIGTPISVIRSQVGEPYTIHSKGGGVEEYEYIERIDMGRQLIAENHYFLIVKDGRVIGKRFAREKPPTYELIYQDDPNYHD